MTDRLDPARRSANMSRVRSTNTGPELRVRRAAHRLGLRFRLHRRDLPGTPDLVFPGRRAVMFVHGCFWHRHEGCRRSTIPQTRTEFWEQKFVANQARDERVRIALTGQGWKVYLIWECETEEERLLNDRLRQVLGQGVA